MRNVVNEFRNGTTNTKLKNIFVQSVDDGLGTKGTLRYCSRPIIVAIGARHTRTLHIFGELGIRYPKLPRNLLLLRKQMIYHLWELRLMVTVLNST